MVDLLENATTAPKFAAPDPAALAAWYQTHLGFSGPSIYAHGDYAIVKRGDMILHFWKCDERKVAEHTACYVTLSSVTALNALHAEFIGRSNSDAFAPGRVQPSPHDAAHGMREFHVWDPAGNLIGFGAKL